MLRVGEGEGDGQMLVSDDVKRQIEGSKVREKWSKRGRGSYFIVGKIERTYLNNNSLLNKVVKK